MSEHHEKDVAGRKWTVTRNDPVLVTGAAGFVGSRVVSSLLRLGFTNLRCLVRASSDPGLLNEAIDGHAGSGVEIITGNLLSRDDCRRAADSAAVVYHLVAGRGKSFPACFQGSAVTTRNLLDAVAQGQGVRRFVNVSSLAVYSNYGLKWGSALNEDCPLETHIEERCDAYVYGKLKQDELVARYGAERNIPYTILRPGIVFGPGKNAIPGTVGIDTFGLFFHLGGANMIPLTYVDNCADAIVLAGLVKGVEGEVFNVVDDRLPRSRDFLRLYKRHVGPFASIPIPYGLFYLFSWLWECYAHWSQGQLPAVINRRSCAFSWKSHTYPNRKLKEALGWWPKVPMDVALTKYIEAVKKRGAST